MEQTTNYHYWEKIQPPIRPSKSVVAYFSQKVRPGSRVLLLGSTPEYRSLCHEKNCDLTVVDASFEIYHNMNSLLTCEGEESFIQEDWQMVDFDREFDFVLGDGSLNMLPFSELPKLIKKIAGFLVPRGLFMIHFHYRASPRFSTLAAMIEHWREKTQHHFFQNTYLDFVNLTLSQDGKFNSIKFAEIGQKLFQKGILKKEEFEEYALLAKHNLDVFFYSEHKFKKITQKYFTLQEEFVPTDYVNAEQHPVLCFEKNN